MKLQLIALGVLLALLIGGAYIVHKTKPLYAPEEPIGSGTSTQSGQPRANITVSTPKPGDAVGLPIIVRGEARTFENAVNAALYDADGAFLAEIFGTAQAPDVGQFGPFEMSFTSYPEPKGPGGTLEVFEYSAKDGSKINRVAIPVRFAEQDTMTVKAFFGNRIENDGQNCEATYPVTRRVAKTSAPARAALGELLNGPTRTESNDGYITSINFGVKINSITIVNGVARADLSDMLQASVGGSCRVTAIRAQITDTLKQFTTVKSVVISIDGRTEDILQP